MKQDKNTKKNKVIKDIYQISEENQYIIENTDTKDANNKERIDGLLNSPLEEENDSLYTKIIIKSLEDKNCFIN